MSRARGGRWNSGFLSGAGGTLLSPLAGMAQGYYSKVVSNAVVGGTISQITGGKFANGAFSGAFRFMFNEWYHKFGKSLTKLWNRKGEIGEDVVQGLEGGLEGYRNVRNNAPAPIKLWLQGVMTATEMGLTSGFVKGVSEVYDFASGMFFDTTPLASKSSIVGFYSKQYIDAFYGSDNYELRNLIPFNF